MTSTLLPETSRPNGFDRASAPETPLRESRIEARFGAVRTLRVLLIGSIIVPLIVGMVGAFFAYRSNYQRAVASPPGAGADRGCAQA